MSDPESASVFARFQSWLSELFTESNSRTRVDTEYLASKEYRWLETFVEIDGQEYVRCNLCGLLFDPDDVAEAVDHVTQQLDSTGMSEEKDLGAGLTTRHSTFEQTDETMQSPPMKTIRPEQSANSNLRIDEVAGDD